MQVSIIQVKIDQRQITKKLKELQDYNHKMLKCQYKLKKTACLLLSFIL